MTGDTVERIEASKCPGLDRHNRQFEYRKYHNSSRLYK